MLKVRINFYGQCFNIAPVSVLFCLEVLPSLRHSLIILVQSSFAQYKFIYIFVSKPYFVLTDAYYIPLVCYLSRKSVQLNIVLTVCVFSYVRPLLSGSVSFQRLRVLPSVTALLFKENQTFTSVVNTAVSILITVLDPKGNVQGYPIYIKSHMPWHLICSILMILPPGSASLQNNDKIKYNPFGEKNLKLFFNSLSVKHF